MSDKDYLSDLKRGREEEFFQRKEKELMEKMRKEASRDKQTVESAQESKAPDPLKPEESESRTPTSRRPHPWIAAIVAIAALIGLVWVWVAA